MSIHDAGVALNKELRSKYWFQAVGVAGPRELHIYLSHRLPKSQPKFKTYEGFTVKWIFVGQVYARPAY